ncbi:MAG: hypothetical protein QNJ72_18045 [Pleurocapsa sp. MO_226.B13]|nr:hypothetical protein [Pleurocapsa sp. MO_226.B13]
MIFFRFLAPQIPNPQSLIPSPQSLEQLSEKLQVSKQNMHIEELRSRWNPRVAETADVDVA